MQKAESIYAYKTGGEKVLLLYVHQLLYLVSKVNGRTTHYTLTGVVSKMASSDLIFPLPSRPHQIPYKTWHSHIVNIYF